MKYFIPVALIGIFSCESVPTVKRVEKCRVDSFNSYRRYGGLVPDQFFIVHTSCGAVLTQTEPCIGDSIIVKLTD